MAETNGSIEDVLKENASDLTNETESEETKVDGPEDDAAVLEKAKDKYDMMNIPTERKVAEDVSKIAAQVHAAEAQKALEIQQGTVNPEHQTYGVLGIPMAAAVHDYTLDASAAAQATVKTKKAEDDKAIKAHNDSLSQIVKNIEEASK